MKMFVGKTNGKGLQMGSGKVSFMGVDSKIIEA